MKKRLLIGALTMGLFMSFVALGFAIPAGQRACTDQTVSTTNGPIIVQGSQVQARIGLIPNLCVITFSAESEASYDVSVNILWSIDGGPCTYLDSCPVDLHQGSAIETNTIECITLLGPGVHNVAPCLTVGFPGPTPTGTASVTLFNRCTTIECQTK